MPHAGPLDHRTIHSAYNFNHPMRILKSISPIPADLNARVKEFAIFRTIKLESGTKEPTSLILDTIKRGEDDEDVSRGELPNRKGRSIIVRVYESLGGMSRGYLRLGNNDGVKAKKVFKTNILEDDLEELPIREKTEAHEEKAQFVDIELRGFEVATFRFQL